MEAASRTVDLLRHLKVPLTVVGGSLRFMGKLGSIAVAALKLLLNVFSFVDADPATRQLSMQEFRLPHFVPPPPPPAVEPAWPTQTVSAISETVTWAQGMATHALAAIEATKQVVLDSEFLLLEHDECSQAELGFSVRLTTCRPLHHRRPAPCPAPHMYMHMCIVYSSPRAMCRLERHTEIMRGIARQFCPTPFGTVGRARARPPGSAASRRGGAATGRT